jgi:Conserved oligomeric complex COG6
VFFLLLTEDWLQSYLQLLGKHSLTLNATEQQQQQQYYDYGLMQLDQSLQHPFVQHALYTLRHVQAFYHHTVELVAGRRRQEETRLFLLALTTGIPQEQQPPLERLAHDPTLYVGEMLAHAFRAMSSEADVALTVIHYKPSSTKKKQQQNAKAATVGSTVGGGDASANGQEGGTEQHGENDDDDEDDDDDDQNDDDLDGSAHSDDFDYGNNMTFFSGTTSSLTDKTMTAAQMLSVTMSGMSRPLHARVQQVIDSLARRPNHRNHNRTQDGSDPSALVLEQVDSDDNMMMLGDDDDIMFDDEGAIVRNKLTHLYEICGLLLFYISAMSKTVGKLQEADINRIKRRLLKKRAKMALLAKDENEEGKNNDNDDDVLETPSAIMDPEANALIVCLIQSLEEAAKAFEASIRVYCAMLNQLSTTTGESQPNLVLAMMVRIAECRMSSPGFAQDVIGSTNQACQTILSIEWVTETLVQAALACCSNLHDTYAVKQALATAKKADIDVIVAEKLDEQIEAMEASLTNKLVETESIKVLDLCGLGSIVAAWNRWKERSATSSVLAASTGRDEYDDNTTAATLMASYPGLSAENVEAGMKDFLASLYSPPLPSLESAVKDPLLRKRARVKIAETVCQTYAELYADITSVSKGGYEDVSFLGHSPDQVKRLFTA